MLGIAHSVAFTVGSLILLVLLRERVGGWTLPTIGGRAVAATAVSAAVTWVLYEAWTPAGKPTQMVALVVLGSAALAIYVGVIRLLGVPVLARLPFGRRGSGVAEPPTELR